MKKISGEWLKFFHTLSESQKRFAAALKAKDLGHGGITEASKVTGLSRTTITRGLKEVKSKNDLPVTRVREFGGGRKKLSVIEPALMSRIEEILNETTAGDPMSPILWTCKSTRDMEKILQEEGFNISATSIRGLLHDLGYSLQSNNKSLSRAQNADRDRQFKIINRRIKKFLAQGLPVISVDTKKKELIGKFKNKGQTWRKKDDPILVEDHDFASRGSGKAIPYGAYDVGRNEGFVNVGITADTAEFAVNSILRWWNEFGARNYPDADQILICADGGGSNSSRSRLWKYNLQRFSDRVGVEVVVCHYPPGTSKWNKIEHKMFSFISSHWRGCPLESYESVIQLIGSTTTKSGLKIKAKLDKRKYLTGKKITNEEFNLLNIVKNRTLPKWNYSILPL